MDLRHWLWMDDMLSCDGTGTFTFDRIVTYSGEKCALIRVAISARVRMLDDDNQEVFIEDVFSGFVHRSLVTGLNLNTEFTGQATFTMTRTILDQPVRLKIHGPISMKGSETKR